jgi:hypothetical protein
MSLQLVPCVKLENVCMFIFVQMNFLIFMKQTSILTFN